jgi:phage recombination protein Bet
MTGTSLIATMAQRYHMEPAHFASTVRRTVMPSQHNQEEFAAFMMVAYEYGLNPILRQIYAYPKKGGGINPVVSLDGWVHLVNTHPQFDGLDFTYAEQGPGKPPLSCTCIMHRKDRSHPITVTEYYGECYRNTEPWNQMPRRMLRHKALKEAARYAFGFSAMDEDDARDVSGRVRDIQKPIIVEDGPVLDGWADDDDISPSTGTSAPPTNAPEEPDEPAGAEPEQPAPADLRQQAIDQMLHKGILVSTPVEQRMDDLEADILQLEEQLPALFLKNLRQIGSRVIKGDLSVRKAREFLEQLP